VQVTVTFRHVDPTDALRDYAIEKVTHVASKYLKSAVGAHVILSVQKQRHVAEINLHATRFDISAHESTDDLYAAIDLTIAKVEAQLRKHKDRINHHKGRGTAVSEPRDVPVEVIESEENAREGAPRIIETDNIPAKPLSVEDAILQLELTHAEFLVFFNSATESVSVVYKRRDGNYGLIAPNV
jgi:putative sigma-54 modulation protein